MGNKIALGLGKGMSSFLYFFHQYLGIRVGSSQWNQLQWTNG